MTHLTTTQRGYGKPHQKARRAWAPSVARGEVACARCHYPIHPGQPWHLDHAEDRTYLGPSHAYCNSRAGGRKARARDRIRRATGATDNRAVFSQTGQQVTHQSPFSRASRSVFGPLS